MSIANLQNSVNGYNDLQGQESGFQTSGKLLDTLGDRVHQAISLKDPQSGGQAADRVDPQEILKGISELSMQHYQGPLAGMNLNNVV